MSDAERPLDEEPTQGAVQHLLPSRSPPHRAHVLVLTRGRGGPGRIELKAEKLIFGRGEDCDVVCTADQVSRQHARFTRLDDEYEVEDLDSLNGLFLNGLRVHRAVLREGDELRLGDLGYEYQEGT